MAREHGAHVGLALAHAERAGAVGLERSGVLDALAPVHRALGLLASHHFLLMMYTSEITSGRMGNRCLGFDLHGMVAHLAHFLMSLV